MLTRRVGRVCGMKARLRPEGGSEERRGGARRPHAGRAATKRVDAKPGTRWGGAAPRGAHAFRSAAAAGHVWRKTVGVVTFATIATPNAAGLPAAGDPPAASEAPHLQQLRTSGVCASRGKRPARCAGAAAARGVRGVAQARRTAYRHPHFLWRPLPMFGAGCAAAGRAAFLLAIRSARREGGVVPRQLRPCPPSQPSPALRVNMADVDVG